MSLIEKEYALEKAENQYYLNVINEQTKNEIIKFIKSLPPADVQPVTFCKDCKRCIVFYDEDTLGLIYIKRYTCGVLGCDVPEGFACNQGNRKGADE